MYNVCIIQCYASYMECYANGTYSFIKNKLIEFSARGAWALVRVILQCEVIESCCVPRLQQLTCLQSRVLFCHLLPKIKV